jgi:hypothetical protein
MRVEEAVRACLAGVMILLSVALALLGEPWWMLLTVFVATESDSVRRSAEWCPAITIFRKLGLKP